MLIHNIITIITVIYIVTLIWMMRIFIKTLNEMELAAARFTEYEKYGFVFVMCILVMGRIFAYAFNICLIHIFNHC